MQNFVEIGAVFAEVLQFILFFKMVLKDVRHFGCVGQTLGLPTMRIWWSLPLCKIW